MKATKKYTYKKYTLQVLLVFISFASSLMYSIIPSLNEQNLSSIQFSKIENNSLSIDNHILSKDEFVELLTNWLDKDLKFEFFLDKELGKTMNYTSIIELKAYLENNFSVDRLSTIHIKKGNNQSFEFASINFYEKSKLSIARAIKSGFFPNGITINYQNKKGAASIIHSDDIAYFSDLFSMDRSNQKIMHFNWKTFEQLLNTASSKKVFSNTDTVYLFAKNENYKIDQLKTSFEKLPEVFKKWKNSNFSTSFYLSIRKKNSSFYSAIFTIGKKQDFQLLDPLILEKVLNINANAMAVDAITYSPDAYRFKWGEIDLNLGQNKNGKYIAKSKVSLSKWKRSLDRSPELSLRNANKPIEEFSLQVKLANQKDSISSGINIGRILSKLNDHTTYKNKKDSIAEINSPEIGSKVLLSGFEYFEGIQNDINVELEIVDDRYESKNNKYQFYWKHIDTVIVLDQTSNCHETTLEIGKKQFIECLKDEPILTSSKEGVLSLFEFSMFKENIKSQAIFENIKCSLKDPELYTKLALEEALKDNIEVGDVIILSSFSSQGIPAEDEISLKIIIKEDPKEFNNDNKNLLFINWGKVKFKATDLGDNKAKKFYNDQVISKQKLLEICEEQLYINREGRNEPIISADLVLNTKEGKIKCSKDSKWSHRLSKLFSEASIGDHINLFLRSKEGYSALLQVHIEETKVADDILGYGQVSDFDTLLIEYAKPLITTSIINLSNYSLTWGDDFKIPLKLIGNPNVFGGNTNISIPELDKILGKELSISTKDDNIRLEKVSLYIYVREPGGWQNYFQFNCDKGYCSLDNESIEKVMELIRSDWIYSARINIESHDANSLNAKVSSFSLLIDNPVAPWRPNSLLKTNFNFNDVFEFQFVYNERGKSLLKIDESNEKYKWMLDKYKDDPNVEIIKMPGFKTIERTINVEDEIISSKEIKRVELLSENYNDIHSYRDFHNFKGIKPQLLWKSYLGKFNTETYCLDDFICSEGNLSLSLGDQELEVIRGELIIIPEDKQAIKYVFDDLNDYEIEKRLKTLKNKSSLYISKLLVKDNTGEILRFPISFAYHLE